MNNKLYWKIRKILLNLVFRFKCYIYKFIHSIDMLKESRSFWSDIIKTSAAVVIKTAFIAFALKLVELLFAKYKLFIQISIDNGMLLDAMIGGIGVAGVILGLYCANISSIYSTKYSDAPKSIANAFQNDKVTRKCIKMLIDYIVFGFIIIIEILLGLTFNWLTVIAVVIWSICVIISYSLAGNRPYRLSDIYAVSFDAHCVLFQTITNKLKTKTFSADPNFQNHFLKITEKQISLLEEIQRYASNVGKNDNSSLCEFMAQNIALVASYWDTKTTIGKDSLWYKKESKYQKWHFANFIETEKALKTGTPLLPKDEHDYLWFENRMLNINMTCFKELLSTHDYLTIYKYLQLLDQISISAIDANELEYYIKHISDICSYIEKDIVTNENAEDRKALAGVVDALSVLFVGILFHVRKHYQKTNWETLEKQIISAIDSGLPIERSPILRGSAIIEYYKKISFEIATEGQRITPNWVLKQTVANEEYNILNSFLDAIADGINTWFSLGKNLLDQNKLFEACIILSRFYEFESKYSYFKEEIEQTINTLEKQHIDKSVKWNVSKLELLNETIANWKIRIPDLLGRCSISFVKETWDNRDDYPDFLGECYNRICADAIDAIICNDYPQFQKDFESLTKLMLFYKEYIRADFAKRQNLYRISYAFYMITFPIVEWAQIGGLAILWGEFFKDQKWSKSVNDMVSLIIKDNKLAEELVDYAHKRDAFFLGFGSRSTLENGWNIRVAQAIEQSKAYETEHVMFGTRLKTDSKLLKAFCINFPDRGFTSHTAEVLWVTSINPKLPEDKRYHTTSRWEERYNHD